MRNVFANHHYSNYAGFYFFLTWKLRQHQKKKKNDLCSRFHFHPFGLSPVLKRNANWRKSLKIFTNISIIIIIIIIVIFWEEGGRGEVIKTLWESKIWKIMFAFACSEQEKCREKFFFDFVRAAKTWGQHPKF